MIHHVRDSGDFQEQLTNAGSKLVLVDFYATWCGPCKMISPKLEAMSKEYTDVVFLKVDVDECEEIASQYNISCMPTFLYFKNGQKVAEFSGANENQLRNLVQQHK